MSFEDLRVGSGRLWRSTADGAAFGVDPPKGRIRPALSKPDRLVRNWFRTAFLDAGLEHTDSVRLDVRDQGRPRYVTGSGRCGVRMVGFEAHAGTTPMRLRRDTRKLTSAHDFASDGGVEVDTPSIDPS